LLNFFRFIILHHKKLGANIKMKIKILLLAVIFLNACSHKAAPIVNNSKNLYKKGNNYNKDKYSRAIEEVRQENLEQKSDKNIQVVESVQGKQIQVGQGDTLYSISKKYQTPLRDLIDENKLTAPYVLKSGTKISIPKPIYYEVKTGDTLYSIARAHRMNVESLISLNELKAPYQVNSGQLLKINSNELAKQSEVKVAENVATSGAAKSDIVKNKDVEEKKPAIVENVILDKTNRFIWPINGAIISKFGPKTGGLYNDGINIKAKEGAPVKAAEDGVVAYVGNELKGYGNLIILKHSGGWITAYAHLSKTYVKRGAKVEKSQMIAGVGSSGSVDVSQLYFSLRKGRDAVNPESYLKMQK